MCSNDYSSRTQLEGLIGLVERGDLASHEGLHGSITSKKSEQKDDRVTAAVLFQFVSDDLVFILSEFFVKGVCGAKGSRGS